MGLRKSGSLLATALVSGLILVLEAFGDGGRELLAWSRSGILDGEVWRLVSGHFVHLGIGHTIFNVVGLWLVWFLVAHAYTMGLWALVLGVSIVGTGLGFWFLSPGLEWYVGLSGVLHGLIAAGVIPGLAARNLESRLLAGILLAKIGHEQVVGPIPGSEMSSGGTVIVDAHLYGVISGIAIGLVLYIRVRRKAPI